MSNYIFLDVDGVLNSSAYFDELRDKDKTGTCTELCEEHVKRLEKIYKECDAKIVLSSTWRYLFDAKEELASCMYRYLVETLKEHGMYIYAHTPDLNGDRPREINYWVQKNCNEEDRFVILDDDFDLFDYSKYRLDKYLVHTRYFCYKIEEGGLQQEHVDKAISILRGVQL